MVLSSTRSLPGGSEDVPLPGRILARERCSPFARQAAPRTFRRGTLERHGPEERKIVRTTKSRLPGREGLRVPALISHQRLVSVGASETDPLVPAPVVLPRGKMVSQTPMQAPRGKPTIHAVSLDYPRACLSNTGIVRPQIEVPNSQNVAQAKPSVSHEHRAWKDVSVCIHVDAR